MKSLVGVATPSAVATAIGLLCTTVWASAQTPSAPDPSASAPAAGSSATSMASQPATSAAPTPPAASDLAIERVVVTAQKRPQFAEKVPMSLSAISQDTLDKQNAVSIQDIARLTPGLAAESADIFGTPNISIRGVASTAGSATTAIYIDDAPIATRNIGPETAGTAYPELFDLDRVEVLRGPQGTLFGSGAEGGAVRFITPTPSLSAFSGLAHAGIAGSDRGGASYQTGAAVGGPLVNDELAFRTSLWRKHDGGYIDHVDRDTGDITGRDTNADDATVGRTTLLWRPTRDLTITPSILYQDDFQHDRGTYYESAGAFRTYNRIPQPERDHFTLSSLAAAYDTDSVELKSVTSYYDRHERRIDDYSYVMATGFNTDGSEELPGQPNFLAVNHEASDQQVFTQEFRLASNDDDESAKLSWVTGVYLSTAKQIHHQIIVQDSEEFAEALYGETSEDAFGESGIGPDGAYGFLENDSLRDRSAALFGEAYYKFDPRTTLTLGLRAGVNAFNYYTHQDGPVAGGLIDYNGTQRGNSLLPKVAVSHDLSSSDMVYASASKGNRVGGANPSYGSVPLCNVDFAAMGISDNPRIYKQDSLWSYELGYKGRLFDQRLEIAASIFRIDWKDIQQSVLLPTCDFNYTTNLGNARSQGGDVQMQLRASKNLLLSGSVAYTDARYTATNYASSDTNAAAVVASGETLPEPPLSIALGAEYDWAPRMGTKAFARIDYQRQSSFHRTGDSETYNYDPGLYRAPGTDYFTLHGGYTVATTSYGLYVDNLFNTRTEIMRTHNAPDDPTFQAMTFRPRTLGLTADYKF